MLDNPVSLGLANRSCLKKQRQLHFDRFWVLDRTSSAINWGYMMNLELHEDWHCAQCLLALCKAEPGAPWCKEQLENLVVERNSHMASVTRFVLRMILLFGWFCTHAQSRVKLTVTLSVSANGPTAWQGKYRWTLLEKLAWTIWSMLGLLATSKLLWFGDQHQAECIPSRTRWKATFGPERQQVAAPWLQKNPFADTSQIITSFDSKLDIVAFPTSNFLKSRLKTSTRN